MIKVRPPRLNRKNKDEKYIKWCIKTLEKHSPRIKKDNENYNALSMYCNKNVEKYLHKNLDPMIFLNYSPEVNDNLKGFKIYIQPEEILTKK